MYELTVKLSDGSTVTRTCKTFKQLSRAIDWAWKMTGFAGYVVKGA
jgi:hypothetical protein